MRMGGVYRSLEIREKKPSGLEIILKRYMKSKVYMLRLAPKLTKQHIELPAFSGKESSANIQ